MANEKQADQARRRHADALTKLGAHAVGVAKGDSYGQKGFVIVAHIEPRKKAAIPNSLTLSTADGEVEVPVVLERSEQFKPE